MRHRGSMLLVVILFLVAGQSAGLAGERKRLRLPWSELGPVIADKKVALIVPGGTAIEGKALSVEPGALRLHVTKTSDSKAVRKGETSIPRSSVSAIRIARYSRHWRLLLTPGLPAAMLGAMAAAASRVGPTPDPAKIVPIGLGVAVAATVTGYYVGKLVDRRELTEITVVPEAQRP